jgi:hypothetical protein
MEFQERRASLLDLNTLYSVIWISIYVNSPHRCDGSCKSRDNDVAFAAC